MLVKAMDNEREVVAYLRQKNSPNKWSQYEKRNFR